jgi:hypothetical protein
MKISEVGLPSNRKFGFFFTVVFVAAGVYFLYEESAALTPAAFGLSVLIFIVSLAKPELLLPLNKLWMRLGLLLGMISTPIVMGVIFFGLFTPIAILMRLFGRDELRLKVRLRQSHWKLREISTVSSEAFKNQF